MSNIASRNQQQEQVDVNNLWKWPTEMSQFKTYIGPTNRIDIEFDKWYGEVQHAGWMNANAAMWPMGSFTDNSMTTYTSTGYSLGCFINLYPGTYTFECTSDIESIYRFIEYMQDNGKWKWCQIQKTVVKIGQMKTTFNVPDKRCILLKMSPTVSGNKDTGPYSTFTDVKIREGIV